MTSVSGVLNRRCLTLYRVIFALSAAFLLDVSVAQQDSRWKAVCEQAKQEPVASIQPAGPLPAEQLPKCDEASLYYGIGRKPDYAAALQCAWFHRAHPQDDKVAWMFAGPGMLTMLYANGRGVERNYDIAIRLACEVSGAAQAELEARFDHLEHLRAAADPSAPFDLCDDQTSGLSEGSCTSIQTSLDDVERDGKIEGLVQGLPAGAKGAFAALQAAEAAFEAARSGNEVDMTGTARGSFYLHEEATLRDQFLDNLQSFGRADTAPASETDLAELDKDLNTVYRHIEQSPDSKWQYTTIGPIGIKNTERKWIALADTWVAFGRLAYPKLSATQIRAQIIRLRLDQLRELDFMAR